VSREIQLRSRLQHAWATTVETVDTFTRQAIKTGGGKAEWRRFFFADTEVFIGAINQALVLKPEDVAPSSLVSVHAALS
jgi:hypothetical protein